MADVRALDLDRVTVGGRKLAADVADAVVEMSAAYDVGTVAELSLTLIDPNLRLAKRDVVSLGSIVEVGATRWQVGAVDRTYAGYGAMVTVRARSALGKRLRATKRTGATKGRNVRQWLSRLAKEAGGAAIVQNGPVLKDVTISNGQTVLDAIASVTGAANMTWVEFDGVIYAGTPWWAYQGGPGLPTWPLTWRRDPGSDIYELSSALTDDDKEQSGTATLAVPQVVGARMRPWHRITLTGTGGDDDGTWLVTSVEASLDGTTPTTVQVNRPRRSKPTAGSTAESSAGTAEGGLATASGKGAIAVRAALAQVGEPYTYNAQPPNSWDCSKLTAWAWGQAGITLTAYTYTQVNECVRISESDLVPGDLIFYFRDAHHVSMYIGGGQIVEAANPTAGVRVTSLHNAWNDAHVSGYYRPIGA